jgi:hypothetical protein
VKGIGGFNNCLFEALETSACEHNVPAIRKQRDGSGLADAGTGAGDYGNPLGGSHGPDHMPFATPSGKASGSFHGPRAGVRTILVDQPG